MKNALVKTYTGTMKQTLLEKLARLSNEELVAILEAANIAMNVREVSLIVADHMDLAEKPFERYAKKIANIMKD